MNSLLLVTAVIEVGAGLALETAPLNDVEQMRDDAGLDEALAVLIE